MSKKKAKNLPEEELKTVTGGYVYLGSEVVDLDNKCTMCGVSITNRNKTSVPRLCSACYQNNNT